jgi:hypothetical protein
VQHTNLQINVSPAELRHFTEPPPTKGSQQNKRLMLRGHGFYEPC